MTPRPILLIDNDEDDQLMLEEGFAELGTRSPRKYFITCKEALDYLLTTTDQPFLIISDVNLPLMDGPRLKQLINENEYLRKKAIPFIFLTTTAQKEAVTKAYEMMVQGYFEKPNKQAELVALLTLVLDYWHVCRHPNSIYSTMGGAV